MAQLELVPGSYFYSNRRRLGIDHDPRTFRVRATATMDQGEMERALQLLDRPAAHDLSGELCDELSAIGELLMHQ